jgi:DNA-binding NtrC family response regulator
MPEVCVGIAGILYAVGYEAHMAYDTEKVLVVLTQGRTDVLVVDLQLPPDGGLSLLGGCEQPPPTVVTGVSLEEEMRNAVSNPRIVAALTRPFHLQDLHAAVAKAFSRRAT